MVGWIARHVDCVKEMFGFKLPGWDEIAFEVEEHLHVASLVIAICKELWVAREKSFWKQEECYEENSTVEESGDPVVPSPACGLSKEAAN